MDTPRILLITKLPEPGKVKQRLAASIGPEAAARFYRDMVGHVLAQRPHPWAVDIHFAPADAETEMRAWLGDGYRYLPQCDGDLGVRLCHACRLAFADGASHVVCIGGDCPSLTAHAFHAALESLDGGADVVFAPARDGGYVLCAMKAPQDEIFRDIPWSTPQTLQVSLLRAEAAGLRVALLEPHDDVDTLDDLHLAMRQGYLPHPSQPGT